MTNRQRGGRERASECERCPAGPLLARCCGPNAATREVPRTAASLVPSAARVPAGLWARFAPGMCTVSSTRASCCDTTDADRTRSCSFPLKLNLKSKVGEVSKKISFAGSDFRTPVRLPRSTRQRPASAVPPRPPLPDCAHSYPLPRSESDQQATHATICFSDLASEGIPH